jgi:hypothetical protein
MSPELRVDGRVRRRPNMEKVGTVFAVSIESVAIIWSCGRHRGDNPLLKVDDHLSDIDCRRHPAATIAEREDRVGHVIVHHGQIGLQLINRVSWTAFRERTVPPTVKGVDEDGIILRSRHSSKRSRSSVRQRAPITPEESPRSPRLCFVTVTYRLAMSGLSWEATTAFACETWPAVTRPAQTSPLRPRQQQVPGEHRSLAKVREEALRRRHRGSERISLRHPSSRTRRDCDRRQATSLPRPKRKHMRRRE